MLSDGIVQSLFGRFQNLNLLVLIGTLREHQAAKGDWSASDGLCPVAHGLPEGRLVQEARFLSQADDLAAACRYSARRLGANPYDVQRFVDWWDSAPDDAEGWLLEQLEGIWQERLQDALTVQQLLEVPVETEAAEQERQDGRNHALRNLGVGLLVLLAAFGIGCGRSNPAAGPRPASETAGASGDWLMVSTDSGDLRQARVLAKRTDASESADILDHPERIWFVDEETERLLKQHREQVVPKLVRVISSPADTETRTRAASLLIRLGDTRGREVILSGLGSESADARLAALDAVSGLHEVGEDQPHLDLLFAAPPAAELVLRALDDPDPQVQRAAIQACGVGNVPGHVEKFRQLIHRDGSADRGRIAYWLAANGDPAVVVDDIARFFREGMTEDDVYSTVNALDELAEKGDDRVVARVLELVQEYYRRKDIDRQKLDSSVGWQLTFLLTEHAHKEMAPWLLSQLRQPADASRKGDVLQAYARVEGAGWRELLFKSLEGELKLDAAAALGDKLAGTADAEPVQKLSASLKTSDQEETIAAICEALIEIGGDQARQSAAQWVERCGPWQRMDLTWKLNGWTLDSVKPTVVQSGFMDEREYDLAKAKVEQEGEGEQPTSDLLALLHYANRMLAFDVETGELPCRHDELLQEFAAISDGVFVPEHVSQQWNRTGEDDFEADYTLRFVHEGRVYRVQLQNLGDWYDVERLVTAVNTALEQAGRQERFVPLYSGGQIAEFVFGEQKAIASLAETLKLPIDDDLTQAMRAGKEFEERVLEQYRDQGEIIE